MASLALFMSLMQTVDDSAVVTTHYLLWITISVAIIAVFFLLLMIGSAVAAVKMIGMVKKMELLAHRLEGKANPIIAKTEGLIDDLTPKIKTITDNVVHISGTARTKSDEIGTTVSSINQTVADANSKTRAQMEHVNGLVSEALATSQEISRSVQNSVRVPIRQVAGLVAGLKVGLETWISRMPFGRKNSSVQVEEGLVSGSTMPPSPYDL